MDTLIDFLINNYIWFLVIFLILIFALIGYLVDITNQESKKKKQAVTPIKPVEEEQVTVHPSVEVYTYDNFDEPLISDKNT